MTTCPINESIELKNSGALPQALIKLDDAISAGHDLARAYYQRGLTKVAMDDSAAAEQDFRLAIEHRPTYTRALVNLALLRQSQDDLTEAESLLRAAVATGAGDGLSETALANVLRVRRNPDAVKFATLAVQLAPNLAAARFELATATLAAAELGLLPPSGRTPNQVAEFAIRTCLLLEPTHVEAYNCLAAILDKSGRPTEALQEADRGLGHDPDHASLLQTRGCALLHLQRPDDALPSLLRVLEQRPESFESHYNLACALSQLGELERAVEHVRSVSVLAPAAIRRHVLAHMGQDKDLAALHGNPEFQKIVG